MTDKSEANQTRRNGYSWRRSRLFKFFAIITIVLVLSGSVVTTKPQPADALCTNCFVCNILDCLVAALLVEVLQEIFTSIIRRNIRHHINSEQNWIVARFFRDYWVRALAELSRFLAATGMYQMHMIGTFFDAKLHLETQRLFQQLQAEAHKDYHPSEDFCWFGTNTRSLASTDQRVRLNKLAISRRALNRQMGLPGTVGASGSEEDFTSRWRHFTRNYCDPMDNAWQGVGTGLDLACDHDGPGGSAATGATVRERINRDINYTKLVDAPRTLNINFADTHAPADTPHDEQDIMAMAMNLYGHDVMNRDLSEMSLANAPAQNLYLMLRSVVAKRSVAQNSFSSIVALKSRGTNAGNAAGNTPDVGMFMAAAIRDLMPAGTPDEDVIAILGENPSYYAQLEFLAKKIYQNPSFFANLYDKPANVERKSVAMKAIDLMLDRALYESELRQEMLLSVLLSSELQSDYRRVNKIFTQSEGTR